MTLPRTAPPPTPATPSTLPALLTIAERALRQMTGERHLVPPRDVYISGGHVSFYFADTPLSAFVEWLNVLGVVDVQSTENLAGSDGRPVELTGLLATGHYGTVPILLHAVTEVRVPRYPSVTDLRAAAETDAHLRDAAARMRAEGRGSLATSPSTSAPAAADPLTSAAPATTSSAAGL